MDGDGSSGVPGDRPRIWVLSTGSYSDYSVVAAFPTKALAEAAMNANATLDEELWSGNTYRVESLPLFIEPPQIVTTYSLSAEISDNGTVRLSPERTRREWEFDQLYQSGPRPFVRFVRAPVHKDKGGRLDVHGTDQRAVEQAFSDNVARIRLNAETTGKAGPQVHV